MFRLILVLLLCLPYLAIGQNEKPASSISTSKSIKPLPQSTNHQSTNHQTRAVVIGISDYQDPAIPDLRFADRDAEAFADWLRSPAGGSLPESSIHLLLDKDATTGKIIAALDGLISASKPGDVAILYFSGHGDVERVTKFQRGYFLTWDSPPAVYAAGAFSLVFLQDIISTLSETGVQVVVVSDACRAGKLAGSEFGGAQATSAAMAKQFANEIKILSCQPDEFSLEGEQWGGGRGAFSYHLVDGLYGLADGNSDGTVSLLELGRYLEDKVPGETAPHSQIPFTVGSKAARVASVDAEMLTSWREKKKGETQTFVKTDGKGLEDLALAKADSSIQEMYVAFTAAIERGELMPTDSTAGRSANDYYELLIKEPALADLHGLMTRNFAAALMDEGQQHLNLFLKTDPQLLDDIYNGRVNYQRIADYIQRSAELLGPKHYVYSSLQAKLHYFISQTFYPANFPTVPADSLSKMRRKVLHTGLHFAPDAPYLIVHLLFLVNKDSASLLIKRLDELTPHWILGLYYISVYFADRGDLDKSIQILKKIVEIDSTFSLAYSHLGFVAENKGDWEEANKWRQLYVKQIQKKIVTGNPPKYALEYFSFGYALWQLRQYEKARIAFLEGNRIANNKNPIIHCYLSAVYADMGRYEVALQECAVLRQMGNVSFSTSVEATISHFLIGDFQRGEIVFNKMLESDNLAPDDYYYAAIAAFQVGKLKRADTLLQAGLGSFPNEMSLLFWKAEVNRLLGVTQVAEDTYKNLKSQTAPVFRNHDNLNPVLLYYILASERLGQQNEAESIIIKAKETLSADAWFHFNLCRYYSMTGKLEQSLSSLSKAVELGWEPNISMIIFGTVKDPMLDPLRHLPEFQAWEKRWSPPYKDYSKE